VPTNEHQRDIEFPVYSAIPQALTAYDQWVNWDLGSDAIVQVGEPVSAREAYEMGLDNGLGLGFMLSADDPFVVAELYDAIDTDRQMPKPWAYALMRELDSYAEIDHSILRIFMTGRTGNCHKDRIALYSSGILVPVTGNTTGTHTQIQSCQVEIDVFAEKHLAPTVLDLANDLERNSLLDKDTLGFLLDRLFQGDDWHEQPELFPFIAKCWSYPDLKLRILGKVQMWRKDRFESFMTCLNAEMPKKETEAKPKPERREREEAGSKVDLEDVLQVDARGKAKETFYNMSMILQNHIEWKGRLRFDTFRRAPTLDNEPLSDILEGKVAEWFGDNYGFGGNHQRSITRAIQQAASAREYDSLLEWVHRLPKWDGTERLNTWLVDLCGAKANNDEQQAAYVEWVGRVSIMQMMARALSPGCLARYVLILEGDENIGKSTLISKLGGKWATTFKISMDSKEAHMAIQGFWVAELEELDTMYKTTEQRLKAFITNTDDHFIPKYANYAVTYPRRCVFIGTTNDSRYLKGLTGNTRFLPVRISEIDFSAVDASRDQLLAEALHILTEDPTTPWWVEPKELMGIIGHARDMRREINVYEEELRSWLDGEDEMHPGYKKTITWQEIAKKFLGIENRERWKDKSLQAQILGALPSMGWARRKVGSRSYWERIETAEEVPF
jgi:predicted P-loop ATPase